MRMFMSFIVKSKLPKGAIPGDRRRSGFTLLELIGVLVIISILAAAVVPSAIDLIQVQRAVNESAELPKIAQALKLGMIREQTFPSTQLDSTGSGTPTVPLWWQLAARHGGGSINEVGYPLGVRPGAANTRRLYFAKSDWDGGSFFEITGDGTSWLNDPLDPNELRLLLVSTTNSTLPLPDSASLTENQFNALWEDWAIGEAGNPIGTWSSYGLNDTAWAGRAAELTIERVDLRDLLATVLIENRVSIVGPAQTPAQTPAQMLALGDLIPIPAGQKTDWVPGSVYAFAENCVGAVIHLQTSEQSDGNVPPSLTTTIEGLVISRHGIITDDTVDSGNPPRIQFGGQRLTSSTNSNGNPVTTTVPESYTVDLELTDLAPISLINPRNPSQITSLNPTGFSVTSERFHFLLGQELLLGAPKLNPSGVLEYPEVGIYTIDQTQNNLRFDGVMWQQ